MEEDCDFANHDRQGLATGEILGNRLGNSAVHPTVIVSPAVSVGARACHPTADILPSGRAAEKGDPTARSRPGGSAAGDLTARRGAGDRAEDSDPTARRTGADPTAVNYAGGSTFRHTGGCAEDADPTVSTRPAMRITRNPTAEEHPSVCVIDRQPNVNSTADTLPPPVLRAVGSLSSALSPAPLRAVRSPAALPPGLLRAVGSPFSAALPDGKMSAVG
ncbi:hypothetical protein OIU74_014642 [Salix koriyanagi]|uniref:Uncharacterized protein n=1 Tax=Salix koriyanagi TaxID=2511006 RepID=A0A9Q0SZ96_9ROSI|nr:hypothetical protein OIU74_014642 [Salix koriyanagi]